MTTETQTETQTETETRGRPRKLSDEALARAQQKYQEGWSPEKIARQSWCKVSPHTLRYHFRGCSPRGDGAVEMRGRGRPTFPEDKKEQVRTLYVDEGLTLQQIRDHKDFVRRERVDGVSHVRKFALATLSKVLKEMGVELKRGRRSKAVEAEAEA